MNQTHESFKAKWENNKDSFYSDLLNSESEITQWLLNRNNFNIVLERRGKACPS